MPSVVLEELTWVEAEEEFHRLDSQVGSHANEHETSMMLAIDPAVVRTDRMAAEIQPWMSHMRDPVRPAGPLLRKAGDGIGNLCPSGVIGDPTRATAAKGEAILTAMAADVVNFCRAEQF